MANHSQFSAGDWVEVRSEEEILATLDTEGRLEGMPFMPEMLGYCGQKFQVFKRAHKTCDTVFPVRGRRLDRTVHLETRCNGEAHGGCEAACLLFWKDAWLKPATAPQQGMGNPAPPRPTSSASTRGTGCTQAQLRASVQVDAGSSGELAYRCQATQLPYASHDLSPFDWGQYWEDYTSGNVGLWRLLCGAVYSTYFRLSRAGLGLGRPMRWLYDRLHPLWGGTPFPRKTGQVPHGEPTPTATLNLQPGEWVRVKSYEEILKTLGPDNKNRGMYWDAELVPYCGKRYRVLKRVTKLLDERTGKMLEMKNPCIILESVVCQARYSTCRMFCPRSIYPYWREIWLERV